MWSGLSREAVGRASQRKGAPGRVWGVGCLGEQDGKWFSDFTASGVPLGKPQFLRL